MGGVSERDGIRPLTSASSSCMACPLRWCNTAPLRIRLYSGMVWWRGDLLRLDSIPRLEAPPYKDRKLAPIHFTSSLATASFYSVKQRKARLQD